jgi:pimeloyl-ACP methyl ester carboxylesterase
MPPPLAYVATPEGPVRYARAGRGSDVVLLHGAMTSIEDMLLGPFDALAERFQVTAFDRPGHGATPRARLRGAPSRQASQVLAAMDALGVERPVVLGQSFGAAVALDLAVIAPDRVRAVVAISPIAYPEVRIEHLIYGPRAVLGLGETIGYGPGRMLDAALLPVLWRAIFAPQPIPERFAHGFPFALASGPGQMLALGEEAMLSLPDLAVSALRYPFLAAPLVVLSGLADWLSPPWTHAAHLAGAVPNAQLRLLPGLGHMLHHFAAAEILEAVAGLT